MKRKIAFLVSLFLATTVITPISANAQEKKGYLKSLIEAQSYTSDKGLFIQWDESKNVPRFISGNLSESAITSNDSVQKYLQENLDSFNLKGGTFKLINTEKDKLGFTHYKYQFQVDGISVYGSEVIVHVNKDGIINTINGQTEPSLPIAQYSKNYKVSKDVALKNALKEVKVKEDKVTKNKIDSVIYESNKKWYSVYQVNLAGQGFNWIVFVDGESGKTIDKYDNLAHEAAVGTGVGQRGDTKTLNINSIGNGYNLEDVSRPGKVTTYDADNGINVPGDIVKSNTTTFNTDREAAAVDAHYYVGKSYEYFKNNFGREGFDGRGGALKVTVHYDEDYLNAYFDGYDQLVFGDGDGKIAGNFAKAFDVVSHEFTHGVTENSAKLTYRNQSGALNESFSDVFGVVIENKPQDFWTMGEDLTIPGQPIKVARSLSNPKLYGQPDNMSGYVNTTSDAGGVHTNSGIPNKAFYNIATAIGTNKAASIYYRALTSYLFSSANFTDARSAVEKAAFDLYGANEKWYASKGFYDVGIGKDPGANPGTNQTLKAANISVDNANNTGNYNLKLVIPKDNTARTVKLIENSVTTILSQNIDVTLNDVVINKAFSNKEAGSYNYLAEVSDGTKTVTSEIKVTVTKSQVPVLQGAELSVDKPINDGNYVISIKLPNNNTAKTVKLFENTAIRPVLTKSVSVVENPLSITKVFSNKKEGLYNYKVEVSDGKTVKTDTIVVNVKKSKLGISSWEENGVYKIGDKVIYKDNSYTCIQSHNALPNWTPDIVPALWGKQ
ncbi:Zn-dependent metalloprotease [Clostridium cavendishii DSM 21758]|uniref:Zn-dependent metalloprotease n=1 Tax=Clostridium cavendishii DSM 21758 TaxID=1121302 RepID=A0A1M6BHK0_9CLOT|nr:M4 family metallopeptidase [Clostridium cavendishii]SHI48157.1 Zn-dependent metalloprotease [Clostridium cavendishii DSM 21758]